MECFICGKEYFIKLNHYLKGTRKTCSKECGYKYFSLTMKGKHRKSVTKNCVVCGKEIYIKQSHNEVEGTYCSKECMAIGYKERQKGAENPNWKGGSIIKKCLQCGKEMEVIHAAKDTKKFCSRSCGAVHRVLNGGIMPTNKHTNIHIGKREDLNNLFVRSSWEANYARYLNWLIELEQIKSWEYEPEAFQFDAIKKGNRSYIPDFKIINNDGSIEYHEVKGYMDAASKTKLKRMAKYYPEIKIVLIDSPVYRELHKQLKNLIPNWELTTRETQKELGNAQ